MKKFLFSLILFSLFLGVTAIGQCAEPVSFEKGDFTIDGVTVGDNIKTVIAQNGKPSLTHKPDKNTTTYHYRGRYTLLAENDGTVWYIATTSLPIARGIKVGMSKKQVIEAYGANFTKVSTPDGENYEYLDETAKIKIAFVFGTADKILQIDCNTYK